MTGEDVDADELRLDGRSPLNCGRRFAKNIDSNWERHHISRWMTKVIATTTAGFTGF